MGHCTEVVLASQTSEGFVVDQKLSDLDQPWQLPSKQIMLNQNVLRKMEDALKLNSECDILSVIPASYKSKMAKTSVQPSAIALLNRRTIDRLQSLITESPEIDLLSRFPKRYRIDYDRNAEDANYKPLGVNKPAKRPDPPLEDTLTLLASTAAADVIFPLSDAVNDLISRHIGDAKQSPISSETLALSTKRLFSASEKLWEYPLRGAVFKCSDEIVAKVILGFRNSTEYTSMQYLQKHVPEIPAPRVHGLVKLGDYTAIFMTYIPSITLEKAWPSLCHEQKVSVQHQLNDILTRMREMKQPDGFPLGGVGGEGVNDLQREDYQNENAIETVAGFEDFKFSISKFASDSYIRFLKALLPATAKHSVFTHGDFRPGNIMVQMDHQNDCVVKGLVDWEDSGFYPEFHEATKCTNLLDAGENTDWYEYLPRCISPSSFPQWWLVDRLWGSNIKFGH